MKQHTHTVGTLARGVLSHQVDGKGGGYKGTINGLTIGGMGTLYVEGAEAFSQHGRLWCEDMPSRYEGVP